MVQDGGGGGGGGKKYMHDTAVIASRRGSIEGVCHPHTTRLHYKTS